ncbi:hypothetical protein SeLEV6574_g01435 [Synchytrium endobioticum]|uniref:C2H2-type domain-containing protein n=1 Tax=Synchytrium endobioticum TaxID=286115 RepID=A0A507DFA7_9FUNG|nr:hypothetical protein SeLEV6574_g01435 [Synchytrium endobioticum]
MRDSVLPQHQSCPAPSADADVPTSSGFLMDALQSLYDIMPPNTAAPSASVPSPPSASEEHQATADWINRLMLAQQQTGNTNPGVYAAQSPLANRSNKQQQQQQPQQPPLQSPNHAFPSASNSMPDTARPRCLPPPNTFPVIVRTLHRDGTGPDILLTPSPPATGTADADNAYCTSSLNTNHVMQHGAIGTIISQDLGDAHQETILYTPPSHTELLSGESTDSLLSGTLPSPLEMSGFDNPHIFDANVALLQQQYYSKNSNGQYGLIDDYLSPGPMHYYSSSRSPSPALSEDSDMYSDNHSDAYDTSSASNQNRMPLPFSLSSSPNGSFPATPASSSGSNTNVTRSNDFLDPSSAAASDASNRRARRWSAGSLGAPISRARSRSVSSVRSTSSSKSAATAGVSTGNGSNTNATKEPLRCDICGKEFPRKFNLTSHLVSHTSERPYPCSYCEKSFKRKPDLYRHERMVHVPFGCDRCRTRFATEDELKCHECQIPLDSNGDGGGLQVPEIKCLGVSPSNNVAYNAFSRPSTSVPGSPLPLPLLSSHLPHPSLSSLSPNVSPNISQMLQHQQPHYTPPNSNASLVGFPGTDFSLSMSNFNVLGGNNTIVFPVLNVGDSNAGGSIGDGQSSSDTPWST